MCFYSGNIPKKYKAEKFVFRPLTTMYTEIDHAALMVSRHLLREWSDSLWPDDNFSVDANRNDLQKHQDDFESGRAFTYTILNPSEDCVEGCLYIQSNLARIQQITNDKTILKQIQPTDVLIEFWIRDDRIEDEALLLQTILRWVNEDWEFPRLFFLTNNRNNRQCQLYKSLGMVLRASFQGRQGTQWKQYSPIC